MNMKDDLITQMYMLLSMGIDIADGVQYPHNIIDISLTNENEITVWAEGYNHDDYRFALHLKIVE